MLLSPTSGQKWTLYGKVTYAILEFLGHQCEKTSDATGLKIAGDILLKPYSKDIIIFGQPLFQKNFNFFSKIENF